MLFGSLSSVESRSETILMFWIGILKSAWLLKANVEEKEDRIFKGEGEEEICQRV